MKQYILFVVLLLGFAACRPKPLDIEVPQLEPKVVVFSQAIPNQILIVVLMRSFGALDFQQGTDSLTTDLMDQILEDSAAITVSYMGQTDTLFPLSTGIYATLSTLQYTDLPYTLHIQTNKNEQLTATAQMLPQVFFDAVTPVVTRTPEDTTIKVRFEFTDLPNNRNYYMVHVYSQSQADTNALDPNNFFAQGTNVLQASKLLTDQTFSNAFYRDSLVLPYAQPTDSIVVSISNISETYYNYLVLRKKADNWFTQILQEPVNYPTNVEGGGYGFFNTHFPDARFFDLNQW